MQEQERVPLKLNEPEFDNRMTIRKALELENELHKNANQEIIGNAESMDDFRKIITGGNFAGEELANQEESTLTEEEKKAALKSYIKRSHLKYKPKTTFTPQNKIARNKRNKTARKSRAKNR